MVFDRKTYIRNWMRKNAKKYRQQPKYKEYHKEYGKKYRVIMNEKINKLGFNLEVFK